ncbi:MAG: Smr/MutS family protein [Gemmatimonadetes bacterium]|nr:Smr/MutS family protein [Gemmatimonadota bacterium]MBI3504618.1 Smr/MutS family protein [Pseudomonadota bacterium]
MAGVLRALDAARFGAARTLDLRSSLPTAADAVARAEPWLREHQVAKAGEVLIITGRGHGSPDGIPVVREAIRRLLTTLRRKGVVETVEEHTPGSFAVTLATVRRLIEAPRRSRVAAVEPPPTDPAQLDGLAAETRAGLRRLAERALDSLGAPRGESYVRDEMVRQYALLAGAVSGLRRGATDREVRLRDLIADAIEAYDDER